MAHRLISLLVSLTIPEWLGLGGFGLGLFNLGWALWKFRAERREKVRARGTLTNFETVRGRCWSLNVWVTNIGRFPVYVKGVFLNYRSGTTKIPAKFKIEAADENKNPIAIGDEHHFMLNSGAHKDIAALPKRGIWLTVESNERQVYRIRGRNIKRECKHISVKE